MAERFTNAKQAAMPTSWASLYTVPAGKVAFVLGLLAASRGSGEAGCYVQWLDAADGNAACTITGNLSIPNRASVELVAGKILLKAGDQLQGQASAANLLDLTASILEIDQAEEE
ncbi:hypothetical protein [Oceanibaculum indicum]|uniref:Uncharacterized protein n=1 Tax=Oceanibaculum indicum P24 TaxID=1207063 RepID=K2JPQ3_9PROT|nr:hypothetical protein [Oceanibaculum indicum]EKE72479.1 hypothetical protein P24_13768 [Oceanibaculum indicum P24]